MNYTLQNVTLTAWECFLIVVLGALMVMAASVYWLLVVPCRAVKKKVMQPIDGSAEL